MTAEEFWDKIVISEEEKEVSKYFLEYRGVAEHENVRVFLQSLKETTVEYSEIATVFRYDKRIRRIIFKYIGFLEEYLRAYISNTYGENTRKFQHTSKLNAAFNKLGNLFLALSDLTFGQLINQIKLLSEEEKYSNALEFVFEVAFIETSGMHNNNVLQHYDNTNGDFNVLWLEINNYLVTKPLNEIKAKLSLTLEELKSKFLYSQRVKAITALLPFYYLDSEECWKMIQYALEQGREKGIITLTDLSKSGSHIRFNVPKENSSTYFYNSIENVLKRKFS